MIYFRQIDVFSLSSAIEISRLSFSLAGYTLNDAGNIHLKETQSYSVETVVIPPSVRNLNALGLLSLIKRNYNSKLRSSHVG